MANKNRFNVEEHTTLDGKTIDVFPLSHMYIHRLEHELQEQQEKINKVTTLIKKYGKYDGEKCTQGFQMWSADFNKILDILKEVIY